MFQNKKNFNEINTIIIDKYVFKKKKNWYKRTVIVEYYLFYDIMSSKIVMCENINGEFSYYPTNKDLLKNIQKDLYKRVKIIIEKTKTKLFSEFHLSNTNKELYFEICQINNKTSIKNNLNFLLPQV